MPKFTRLTSQYVRRELQRVFRDKYLPLVARHIIAQPIDSSRWEPLRIAFDVESLRPAIEALEALPKARFERGPASLLRDYQKELMIWKRRRTTARTRVAKYARLVRYHSSAAKRAPKTKKNGGGGGNSEISDRWGAGRDAVWGQRPGSGSGQPHVLVKGTA